MIAEKSSSSGGKKNEAPAKQRAEFSSSELCTPRDFLIPKAMKKRHKKGRGTVKEKGLNAPQRKGEYLALRKKRVSNTSQERKSHSSNSIGGGGKLRERKIFTSLEERGLPASTTGPKQEKERSQQPKRRSLFQKRGGSPKGREKEKKNPKRGKSK